MTNSSVVVAMVDTGIDIDHPDLAANLWTNPGEVLNGFDDDGNGLVDDIHGWNFKDNDSDISDTDDHGTFSSGLLGAVGNNDSPASTAPEFETAVTGVLWGVKVMVLRIFSSGPDPNPTEAEIINAYNYAREKGANIVNNSWNDIKDLEMIRSEIVDLQLDDMLFVFSAGNGSINNFNNGVDIDSTPWDPAEDPFNSPRLFPCKFDIANVVCVAAVDENGTKPGFSNWGKAGVHLFAPGTNMVSTRNGGTTGTGADPENDGRPDGTSWSAPQVSAIAAMVKTLNPSYDWRQLRDAVVTSAQPISSLALDGLTQTGNVANARIAAKAFADSFDDATGGRNFFGGYPTRFRWSVVEGTTLRRQRRDGNP